MGDPVPVNALELALRNLLRDKTTPLWGLYTPLAAAEVWVIARHHPELDGSELVAPVGQQPDLLTFKDKGGDRWLGLYTSRERTEGMLARLETWNLRRADFIPIAAPGYQLLRYATSIDARVSLNHGCEGFEKVLDPDMIEILLERGEPPPTRTAAPGDTARPPEGDPERYLAPLRDFLARQPQVRAAWLTMRDMSATDGPEKRVYQIWLLQHDPGDKSLLGQVSTIAKAITPVEMEWQSGVMIAPADELRKLSAARPPFYSTEEFRTELQRAEAG